jgi:Biotin carboxyl carrier protein
VRLGDRWVEIDMVRANRFVHSLRMQDGTQFLVIHDSQGVHHSISFGDCKVHFDLHDPLAMKRKRREDEMGGSGNVNALMPGRVVRVTAKAGDVVAKGTPLLILEAMKMENEIQSPRAGIVKEILVKDGQTVDGGAALLVIE